MRSSIFSSDRASGKTSKRGKPAYISKSGIGSPTVVATSSNSAGSGSTRADASGNGTPAPAASTNTNSNTTTTTSTGASIRSAPTTLKISWNLDDLVSSYTENGSLPPMLSPTLPSFDSSERPDTSPTQSSFAAPVTAQTVAMEIDDDSEEDIPLSMLSPTLPSIFDSKKGPSRAMSASSVSSVSSAGSNAITEYNYVRWVNKLNSDRPRFLLRINFDTIDKYRSKLKRKDQRPFEKKDVPERSSELFKRELSTEIRKEKRELTKIPEITVQPSPERKKEAEKESQRERMLALRERELEKRERELQEKLQEKEVENEKEKERLKEAEADRKRKLERSKLLEVKKDQVKQLNKSISRDTTPILSPRPVKRQSLSPGPIKERILSTSRDQKDKASPLPLPPKQKTPRPNLPQTPTGLPNLPTGPFMGSPSPSAVTSNSGHSQRERDELKKLLSVKKNHWMQIARSARQKADAIRNDPPRGSSSILPFIIIIDSLISRMISYDYDERSKIIADVLPSERSWKNLNQDISTLIADLIDYYSTPREKNNNLLEFSRTLVSILYSARAMISKRINAILSKVIQSYKSKNSPSGELNDKIIELQQLHLDNNNQIITDFINCKPEYLSSVIPSKFPQTYHRRKSNLKMIQQEYDLSDAIGNLKPKYQNFYLPFGVYSNVNEATSFTYHVLNEFIDIFNKYNPNDPMKYTLQSGQ